MKFIQDTALAGITLVVFIAILFASATFLTRLS